jgi:hypothetical protein
LARGDLRLIASARGGRSDSNERERQRNSSAKLATQDDRSWSRHRVNRHQVSGTVS